MNQKQARYERRLRQEWYEYQLKRWLLRKPPWWWCLARRKWKAEKTEAHKEVNVMNKKEGAGNGGIGVTGLLQVAFIVLKLCGVIDWSWLWVLAPTWIGAALVMLILAIALIL